MNNDEKKKLFQDWLKHKKSEVKAKEKRIIIEDELEVLYGTNFKETSKTFKEEELGFKTNLKKNVKYNVDQEAWKSTREDIPKHLRPEKISFSLDLKGYEYLKDNEKEIYKKVSDCVEFKTNKTTVKVEKI